jgi:GTP:adenosylcobinamide-phosphate guanylyltransferase
MEQNNINAIIIATEITKGMKSVGPKALLQIKKTTCVIEYQINELKKNYKNINIYVAIGFESDKMIKILSKHNINIIFNPDFRYTNQVKSIIDCVNLYDINNLLVINNGILFKKSFGCIKSNESSSVFTLSKSKMDFNIGCQKSDEVMYLFYDLPEKWTECVLLNNTAINNLRSMSKNKNMSQLYVFEMVNMLIENGHSFKRVSLDSRNIMKISGIKDLKKAKVFI